MQYGLDTAAVGGLQAMPGFLMVFGYEDLTSPLGYGIDVSTSDIYSTLIIDIEVVHSTAAHDLLDESGILPLRHPCRRLWSIFWPQDSIMASMYYLSGRCRNTTWIDI
jgi:hypothetical protein